KLRLLEHYLNADPARIYTCVISKIKPFGISFEVPPIQYEGFIHISELRNDYYDYNNATGTLTGQNTGKCYKVGEPIDVILEEIDLIVMESKWTLNAAPKKSKKRSSKGRKFFKSRKKR
ncbi:MAG: S1 RNA-binding domain-containing protein, partial [Chlamydiia bacterium]|nr:S1 RNA-binding domain-containing protein [Chlamydiia bacterium]